MHGTLDTIVAQSTASGQSALSLIRLSGDLCPHLVPTLFGKNPAPRKATYAQYQSCQGTLLDDVIYTFFPKGASYTGEPMLEISCHGNPLIVQKILSDLLERDCRLAEPGAFTKRAFLNQRIDLSQAEAVADIIHARSEQALKVARNQLQGSLSHKINHWTEQLLQIMAEVEAYIDFPEEDLPLNDPQGPLQRLQKLQADFRDLAHTSRYQTLLQDGIKTVILGSPNVGKSSLLNWLTGEDRALVSDQPGTTRDFIRERIWIDPFCLQIIDTAGIHKTDSPLEQQGIANSVALLEKADYYLWVLDLTQPLPQLSPTLQESLEKKPGIILGNKADLAPNCPPPDFLPTKPHAQISVLHAIGLDPFKKLWKKDLEEKLFESQQDQLLVNTRHAQALQQASAFLQQASQKMTQSEPTELVAADIREALHHLGEILGKIDNERILDKLFQTFCIGK